MGIELKILEDSYNVKLQEVDSSNFPITEQDRIWYFVESDTEPTYTTNNEFLRLAKDWIFKQGYTLSIFSEDGTRWDVVAKKPNSTSEAILYVETEFDAILEICKDILLVSE